MEVVLFQDVRRSEGQLFDLFLLQMRDRALGNTQ